MSEPKFDIEERYSKDEFIRDAPPDPPHVIVRFTRELEPYDDGVQFEGERFKRWPALATLWARIQQEFPGTELRPLYRTLSPVDLKKLVARAQCRSDKYRPDPFFAYFQVNGTRKTAFAKLAHVLRRSPEVVAEAYVQRTGPPPAVNLANVHPAQFYLDRRPAPAPLPGLPNRWALGGVNAKAAWIANSENGGDGRNVKIIDVERGWFAQHVDLLPPVPPQPLSGLNLRDAAAHGTPVLGILCAMDGSSTLRGVGIAPHVTSIGCVSYVETIDSATCQPTKTNLAGAIAFAASRLGAGDVMLIEATLYEREVNVDPPPPPPTGPELTVPVEADGAIRAAIKLATAAGITVVEPGGNGTDLKDGMGYGVPPLDMDGWPDPLTQKLTLYAHPGNTDYDDCGAIMVSAALVSSAGAPARFHWAPRGMRIDCFAHGQSVFTTTAVPPPPPPPDCSTANYQSRNSPPYFSGTSAAAAIVAGAVATIQGLARAKFGAPFTPEQVRAMLRDQNPSVNTPVLDETRAAPVGVMPDLAGIMQSYLGL